MGRPHTRGDGQVQRMKAGSTDDTYSDAEAQRRFEAALKAALNTPPKPMKDIPKKKPKKASRASS
jgi:hypothetical protein